MSVAFDRLAADEPPALALLTLFAWLSPEPVPQALLAEHPDQLPPHSPGTTGRSSPPRSPAGA